MYHRQGLGIRVVLESWLKKRMENLTQIKMIKKLRAQGLGRRITKI